MLRSRRRGGSGVRGSISAALRCFMAWLGTGWREDSGAAGLGRYET